MEASVFDIGVHLIRVHCATSGLVAVLTAPARQRPDPRFALVIDDIVRIILPLGRAVFFHEGRQADAGTEFDQY